MNSRTKRIGRWIGAAAVLLGLAVALKYTRRYVIWDHFSEVKPGVLYRCGQLRPYQFRAALRRYGIRTVVNLRRESNEDQIAPERRLCRELGVRLVQISMPGDGLGQPEQFRAFLELAQAPEARPVLVHCARGSYRTGASIALYRLQYDGWSLSDAVQEMRWQGCRGDRLPNYVASIWKRWAKGGQGS